MSATSVERFTRAAGSGVSPGTSAAFAGPRPKRSRARRRRRMAARRQPPRAEELGIDHVVSGYCEGNVGGLFAGYGWRRTSCRAHRRARRGGRQNPADPRPNADGRRGNQPRLRLGCAFCTPRAPADGAPADGSCACRCRDDLAAGVRDLMLVTEDVFRYGAQGTRAQPAR